jgi:uncharacterized protein YdeI (YjbR/CyaY-like superfamily)
MEHHADAAELLVGFYKVGSGRPSLTWPQSVDQALCFGWIDGIRRRIDDQRYSIRFTPRRPGSIWSAGNIRRVDELTTEGLMHSAGLAALKRRKDSKSRIYSYEQQGKHATLGPPYAALLTANPKAWKFYQTSAPWYRRTTRWWVMSAKQEATRLRRLKTLVADSAAGRMIGPLRRK